VLGPHLAGRGFHGISARLIGNARQRHRRGGITAWAAVKRDIVRHLAEDQACLATTMVDYYGLPRTGGRAWPGRERADALPHAEKAAAVEAAIFDDIAPELGGAFAARRFIPFVVMHELEGLLFSDCAAFARAMSRPDLEAALQLIRDQFASPEEINDSSSTCPSKRVEELLPGYQKPLHGTRAALEIGLETIRTACPHFGDWIARLEALAAGPD